MLTKADNKLSIYSKSDEFTENNQYNTAASLTYNNIGCYYQKRANYTQSLRYLIRALSFNKKIPNDEINQSSTHLNICA